MAVVAMVACTLSASPGAASAATKPAGSAGVAAMLQQTMDHLQFQQVLDTAPPSTAAFRSLVASSGVDKDAKTPVQRAKLFAADTDPAPIVQQPQIDATVLELDSHGKPVSSGTVLMSPQYPHGIVVPVDQNFHTTAVRWRQWDDAGWYTNHAQGSIDIVPGRESAPIDFMSPYPASVLKLMVNFGVLQLVDQGVIGLDDTYNYVPTSDSSVSLCGGNSSDTIRNYMDKSLTYSDNASSCALLKMLWDHNAVTALNQTFQNLGLETLQLQGTNPATGGHWANPVTMSSLDTAKLLALINGAPGTAWTAPDGTPVTSGVLSASSRAFFKSELSQQGYNDMTSTANWCGAPYPAPGIPQVVPQRWIAPDGTVTVDGDDFARDVRPCNQTAQVTFSHKTGLVNNSAADAGIVKALPGKGGRSYIIAVFSNLGDQYIDPNRPATPPGTYAVTYTQKFAQLGHAIDQFEANCSN
jgi:Beta-lactamase enzyme family